jgi:hypothetical protein
LFIGLYKKTGDERLRGLIDRGFSTDGTFTNSINQKGLDWLNGGQ